MDMMELFNRVEEWVRAFRKSLTLDDLYCARNASQSLTTHLDELIVEHSDYEDHRL